MIADVEQSLGLSIPPLDMKSMECKLVPKRMAKYSHLRFNVMIKYHGKYYPNGISDDDYSKVKAIGDELLKQDWIGSYIIQVANRSDIMGCDDELTTNAPHLCYPWDYVSDEMLSKFPAAASALKKRSKPTTSTKIPTKRKTTDDDGDSSDVEVSEDEDPDPSEDTTVLLPVKKTSRTAAADAVSVPEVIAVYPAGVGTDDKDEEEVADGGVPDVEDDDLVGGGTEDKVEEKDADLEGESDKTLSISVAMDKGTVVLTVKSKGAVKILA